MCVFLPQKPGMDVADGYVTFVRHSQDMLREKVNEEVYTERLFDVSAGIKDGIKGDLLPVPPKQKAGDQISLFFLGGFSDLDRGIIAHFPKRSRQIQPLIWRPRLGL